MTTTITTGEICRRLDLTISAGFITDKLGVPPREKVKAAYHWHEADFATIRDRLAARIRALPATPAVDPLFG